MSSTSEETLQERQESELEVLKAIYLEDVKDLRENDTWKVQRPPELVISLHPQESMHGITAHVMCDLYIKCTWKYPDQIPELKIDNAKGISKHQVQELAQGLKELAKSLVGEVMVLELCQHVQTFLHAHNRPPAPSFYEEMMHNKQKQQELQALEEQKKEQLQRRKEEKELLEIEEEIQKRKYEAKKRKEAQQNEETVPELLTSETPSILKRKTKEKTPESNGTRTRRRTMSSSKQPGRDDPLHGNTASVTFTVGTREIPIIRGRCLGHSPRGSTVFAGMNKDTGELVAVSEWVVRWGHASKRMDPLMQKEADKYQSQLKSMEEEFHSYLRLEHEHLLSYIAFKVTQDAGRFLVFILMEYSGGGHLGLYLKNKTVMAMELIRNYITQTLEALHFLHSNSVAHKDLRASSLLLDDEGKIRLTDFSISKRLTDLVRTVEAGRPGVKFEDVTSLPTIGKGGKKGDIYRLGIILLALAEGAVTKDTLPQVPTHFPQDFQDFLQKCLLKDERARWSAGQLLDHSFVKTPLYATFHVRKCTETEEQGGLTSKIAAETMDKEEGDTDEDIPFIPRSDMSRLQNEFAILKWLGKGGFGDVIKVKNKLDGRHYAIKRIPLNPQRKHFTRKITREVKLLSRLNHENVVSAIRKQNMSRLRQTIVLRGAVSIDKRVVEIDYRYYNSWIETSDEPVPSDSSTSTGTGTTTVSKGTPKTTSSQVVTNYRNSLGFLDDIEKFAPPPAASTSGWSSEVTRTDNDDSFEDVEDDIFGASFMPDTDEDSEEEILFEGEKSRIPDASWSIINDNGKAVKINAEEEGDSSVIEITVPNKLQFLYIQMEFCEKSTLRSAIDLGLYQDMDRVWRLFREIIEGLVHIHEQGMIHRDLKPVNIFLDSNDQVKIGDFGLATIGGIRQPDVGSLLDISVTQIASFDFSKGSSRSDSVGGDGAMTGKVGTALYVSPEMISSDTRLHYSQKVDMYSLGVMFFEMCYRPLDTGMERVRILSNLRQPSITLPEDFDLLRHCDQTYILQWLLNHDPSKRPTSRELLKSEYLPAPQMEEAELNEILRSAISNPESRSYRRMLDAIFAQPTQQPTDFAYDSELHKTCFSPLIQSTSDRVSEILQNVFSKHGALHISTPLLFPKSPIYEGCDFCVRFMDHSGGIVSLPYDLRVPFARYIARKGITSLKRYTIEKVFRENRIYHSHPKEMMCCSFDIVTPSTASLVPDAEVLHVVFDIISEFPVLLNRNYHLRINHVCLLKAILLHCGIAEKLHNQVLAILSDTKTEKQKKSQIQTRLVSLSLSDQTVDQLFQFIETEQPFGKVASMLRCITKTKGESGSLSKKGLHEMEAVISHGENLGIKLQPTLALGLAYNVHHFSGILFQVVTETKKKHRTMLDVFAAGGRYDSLVSQFRRPGSSPVSQTVVGVHIWYDKILSAAMESGLLDPGAGLDVLVCSLGHKALLKEKLSVLKDLWDVGKAAQMFNDTTHSLEDIQDYCKKHHIPNLIILKDIDSGKAWIKSIEDKVADKKVALSEVAEYIKTKVNLAKSDVTEPNQSKPVYTSQQTPEPSSSSSHSSSLPQFNIVFIQQDNTKLAKNTKRVFESQIYSNINTALQHISVKSKVEVIGVELNSQVLRTIAACLELKEQEADFQGSIGSIVERHARHRKYLTKIFDYIHELTYERQSCPVILLYGLKDDSYKFLF